VKRGESQRIRGGRRNKPSESSANAFGMPGKERQEHRGSVSVYPEHRLALALHFSYMVQLSFQHTTLAF